MRWASFPSAWRCSSSGTPRRFPPRSNPLVPALDNAPLLTVHVAMAMISYGIFATSFAAAVGYLLQGSADRYAWLPSHRVLDAVAYRAVIIGFPIFATMIILGSYWASIAWGSYWSWDPKETSALVTWLIYARVPARPEPTRLGGPACGPDPRYRVRRHPLHILREPVLLRPARVQRPEHTDHAPLIRHAAGIAKASRPSSDRAQASLPGDRGGRSVGSATYA